VPPTLPAPTASGAAALPPPWERDVDTEPSWEELVGPDGSAAGVLGGDGEVAVAHGRLRTRRLLAGVLVLVVLAAGAVVLTRRNRSATPAIVSGGLERRLPAAVASAPRLRWRAPGLGTTSDESANGGAGAIVTQDDRHVYALPGDGRNVVTALDLATGDVAWTAALGADARALVVATDVVIVALVDETVALDATTGTVRWRAPVNFAVEVWPGGPLVASKLGNGQSFDLTVLDPSTGASTWTAKGMRGVAIDRHGMLWASCSTLVLDGWRDGKRRWTYDVGSDLCGAGAVSLAAAGSTVAAVVDSTVVGIDIDTGARRWSVPVDRDARQTVVELDDSHVILVQHRPSDADLLRVLDTSTGEFVGSIDGHFNVMRTTGVGGASSLLADNGSSLRLIDPTTFAVADRSIPMDGSVAAVSGQPALAVGATYDFTQSGDTSQLASYDLATGGRRWQVDAGSATRLVAVGKVLVVLDGPDLVAYG
jgi:outer membrane protein assembly factor BamB